MPTAIWQRAMQHTHICWGSKSGNDWTCPGYSEEQQERGLKCSEHKKYQYPECRQGPAQEEQCYHAYYRCCLRTAQRADSYMHRSPLPLWFLARSSKPMNIHTDCQNEEHQRYHEVEDCQKDSVIALCNRTLQLPSAVEPPPTTTGTAL